MLLQTEQITLRHADHVAVITEQGAGLRELRSADRPLIAGYAADEAPVGYQGVTLAPWPNRIGDGRYSFRGETHQLPLNEIDRGNALHGLVFDAPWTVTERSQSHVRLDHRLRPQGGYPFVLDLAVEYRLGDTGLNYRLSAVNVGERAAPYGASFHPYLVAGRGSGIVDDWVLTSPAARYLVVDQERLLPRNMHAHPRFDFRRPTGLRGVQVDHAFTGIAFNRDYLAELTLVDRQGVGSRMTWDHGCPWLQLCIPGDRFPRLTRRALAVEPMTCPPDAFRSGIDLIELEPGASHSMWLEIGPVG